MTIESGSEESERTQGIRRGFQRALNEHGYGFQHAVTRRAKQLMSRGSQWSPVAVELPVDQGPGTRVDVILKSKTFATSVSIVGECKRVNPAFADWCFISAPFTHERRYGNYEQLSLECLSYDPLEPVDRPLVQLEPRNGLKLEKAYHVGIEIKGQTKGDAKAAFGSGTGAIEAAASQVLRGLNGFINTLFDYPDIITFDTVNILLPVIFTTARLWVSDGDLSKADLLTGNIGLEHALTEVDWLWYQYNQSPGLKHSHSNRGESPGNLAELMDSQYIRTVAIVGAGGIDKFLIWTSGRDLLTGFAEA